MEYPLSDTWNLYYDYNTKRNISAESWSSSIKTVCEISSIPEFLYGIENIEKCSKWPLNSNLHFFRTGIKPMWEDEANIKGGKWVIEISKESEIDIDELWNRSMALVISEQIGDKIICGCVYSPRRSYDRFALWINCVDEKAKMAGIKWKEILDLENVEFVFKVHENAIKGHKEKNNNLYVLK